MKKVKLGQKHVGSSDRGPSLAPTKKAKERVIGVYGFVMHEIVHRPFLGVLRYCKEVEGFVPRDLRTLDVIDHDGEILSPPWRGRCDGLIISTGKGPNWTDLQTADWVVSGGVPAVNVGADWQDPRVPCVHTDQSAVGKLAAQHLFSCRCSAYLYVGYAGSSGSTQRWNAFREALSAQGATASHHLSRWHFLGTANDERGLNEEPELSQALLRLPKPLGVWTLNDCFAAAVCLECRRLGLSIPGQVRVLGTDDLALSRTQTPALSSIRTAGETVGYRAMSILHRLLDSKRITRSDTGIVPRELVVRGSTVAQRNGFGTIEAALDYIREHACTGVTVEHVAEVLGLTRRAFVEQFRQHVGHLPGQEIQRVRLEQAKNLLRHPEISITRIASIIGFQETAAFSKFFRLQTGLSPRAFRQQQR